MSEQLVIRNNGGNPCGLQQETDRIGLAIDYETEAMHQQYPDVVILSGCVSCSGCVFLEGGLARCTLEATHPQNMSNPIASNHCIETAKDLFGGTDTFNPDGARITELPGQEVTELPVHRAA